MRDPGLDEAIRAAGGVGALARKIGISQPSLSNWSRVPAERVLSVEGVSGVDFIDRRRRAIQVGPEHRAVDAAHSFDREYALRRHAAPIRQRWL